MPSAIAAERARDLHANGDVARENSPQTYRTWAFSTAWEKRAFCYWLWIKPVVFFGYAKQCAATGVAQEVGQLLLVLHARERILLVHSARIGLSGAPCIHSNLQG